MMAILFRIILLAAIIIIAFSALKYLFHPRRKLEQAHDRHQFFFYDEKDIRRNFFITYKGVMFEGEKSLGTTDDSFEIVSITVWSKQTDRLAGFTIEDFELIS